MNKLSDFEIVSFNPFEIIGDSDSSDSDPDSNVFSKTNLKNFDTVFF